MNVDQLSTQIVAINDAIQILARSNTTVMSHTKEIDGLLQKHNSNDERIREIEGLIHQSCDLKTKEMQELSEKMDSKLSKVYDRAFQYAWQFSAVVGSVGLGAFYYLSGSIDSSITDHASYEQQQEKKNDKIFSELFTVMRDIRTDVGDMKSDMAVMKTNVSHYQQELKDHMEDEERVWKGKQ